MENYLESKEILSEEILGAIDVILSLSNYVVFGGSIALNAIGVIKREIKDIDLITLKTHSLNFYGLLNYVNKNPNEEISETTTDVNGVEIVRIGAKINGVKTCIFKLPSVTYSEYVFLGRKIRIQNVNEAILAKRAYAEKATDYSVSFNKHVKDVESITNNLDFLF